MIDIIYVKHMINYNRIVGVRYLLNGIAFFSFYTDGDWSRYNGLKEDLKNSKILFHWER